MPEIAIIGGGLAGLSAAYHLREPYQLYEARNTVGGIASSFSENGFTFDHAIHILYTKDPYASHLIKTILGDNFSNQTRSSWIYSNQKYTPYPYQANMSGLPIKVILENTLGFLIARFSQQKESPKNFEEWIYRNFGNGIAKNFMLPFNEKVWTIPPHDMNCDWMGDRVTIPRLRDIWRGLLPKGNKSIGSNATFWYPKHGGMKALSSAFVQHVTNLNLNHKCECIFPSQRSILFNNGKKSSYDSIISTLPLPLLLSKIEGLPQKIKQAADLLKTNRVITINIGVDREDISAKHWIYFPEKKYIFQRISFPMNFSESLAPNSTSSITVEISTPTNKPLPNLDRMTDQTINQLTEIGILRDTDRLLVKKAIVIDPAYIIYDNNRAESLQIIEHYLEQMSIISCGRFGEWKYLNMDQAILSGKRAAEKLNK